MNKFFTLKNFVKRNKEQHIWPDDHVTLLSIHCFSAENGFGKAFVEFKGEILIDEKRFWEALEKQAHREGG